MNGFSKIPVKAKGEEVISGVEFEIDTQGLDCILKPVGTDLWIYTKSGSRGGERYCIKDGETFEFCGKLYYMASFSGTVYSLMYNRL